MQALKRIPKIQQRKSGWTSLGERITHWPMENNRIVIIVFCLRLIKATCITVRISMQIGTRLSQEWYKSGKSRDSSSVLRGRFRENDGILETSFSVSSVSPPIPFNSSYSPFHTLLLLLLLHPPTLLPLPYPLWSRVAQVLKQNNGGIAVVMSRVVGNYTALEENQAFKMHDIRPKRHLEYNYKTQRKQLNVVQKHK